MNKTNRKVHSRKKLRAMARFAAKTSLWTASVKFNVQWATVRRACQLTGIAPRRRQSNAEAKARALRLRAEGKTYAEIGRALGYNGQSIYNWCRDAGVIVDRRRAA